MVRIAAFVLPFALLVTPAVAQSPEASQGQDLSYCAGAVAAHAGLNPLTYPTGASGEWAPVLGAILERLNTVDGLEGMTGRYAASAAREFWSERPRMERERMAVSCRDRFAS